MINRTNKASLLVFSHVFNHTYCENAVKKWRKLLEFTPTIDQTFFVSTSVGIIYNLETDTRWEGICTGESRIPTIRFLEPETRILTRSRLSSSNFLFGDLVLMNNRCNNEFSDRIYAMDFVRKCSSKRAKYDEKRVNIPQISRKMYFVTLPSTPSSIDSFSSAKFWKIIRDNDVKLCCKLTKQSVSFIILGRYSWSWDWERRCNWTARA